MIIIHLALLKIKVNLLYITSMFNITKLSSSYNNIYLYATPNEYIYAIVEPKRQGKAYSIFLNSAQDTLPKMPKSLASHVADIATQLKYTTTKCNITLQENTIFDNNSRKITFTLDQHGQQIIAIRVAKTYTDELIAQLFTIKSAARHIIFSPDTNIDKCSFSAITDYLCNQYNLIASINKASNNLHVAHTELQKHAFIIEVNEGKYTAAPGATTHYKIRLSTASIEEENLTNLTLIPEEPISLDSTPQTPSTPPRNKSSPGHSLDLAHAAKRQYENGVDENISPPNSPPRKVPSQDKQYNTSPLKTQQTQIASPPPKLPLPSMVSKKLFYTTLPILDENDDILDEYDDLLNFGSEYISIQPTQDQNKWFTEGSSALENMCSGPFPAQNNLTQQDDIILPDASQFQVGLGGESHDTIGHPFE